MNHYNKEPLQAILSELESIVDNPVTIIKYKKLITTHINNNNRTRLQLNNRLTLIFVNSKQPHYRLYNNTIEGLQTVINLASEMSDEIDKEIINRMKQLNYKL